ncbi:molybdopterin-guanine dinucleotide biosynthesis protein B [Candidatus Bathyarchaeota archaeon]|nr:molybdopterin-guanine dinucleotide biosynthesis protein B [Candidatus Bathyarchaeota archaeon]
MFIRIEFNNFPHAESDRTVLVIAAVGKSGSGKTTTLEYLVSNLASEGYRIGAVKHIYHKGFKIDKEGTNTWRYAKAGAKVIAAVSTEEIVVIKKAETALNDLDQVIGLLGNEHLDIIVVEGFRSLVEKRKDVLKIITAKDADSLKKTLEGTVQPIIAVAGVIGQQKPEIELEIPVINIPEEGKQLLKLVKEHLKTKGN